MAAIFLAVGLELNVCIDLVPLLLLFLTSDLGEEYQRQSPVDGLMTRFSKVNIIDLTVRRRLALSTQIYFPKFSIIISSAVRNLQYRVGTHPLVAHKIANTAKSLAARQALPHTVEMARTD
ncbi:hypothetical protein [Rhizobium leguminosarum]|uniref:hypothetical protein n=1 Tax=Rhizobium leguminosarum TaxID=384 RepID=UPI001C980F6A|nr:hypothetical protein [Rhizobium leguminosarum]MBY5700276.1 hypothetical protein [Rhizobium leguminosarum]